MNDIRQVTNFSTEVTTAERRYFSIFVGNKKYITAEYRVLTAARLTGSASTPINKVGYVCEPKGIDYPIFLTTGNQSRRIQLGKTGMFETMPETFMNINDDEAEEQDCTPNITEIMVPADISFKLDYVFATS